MIQIAIPYDFERIAKISPLPQKILREHLQFKNSECIMFLGEDVEGFIIKTVTPPVLQLFDWFGGFSARKQLLGESLKALNRDLQHCYLYLLGNDFEGSRLADHFKFVKISPKNGNSVWYHRYHPDNDYERT